MKQVAEDVQLLKGRIPIPYAINTYLVGDVLVDAGGRTDTGVILKELRGRELSAHAITHAHPDHQGASHRVCEEFGVPFWVPELDVPPAENPDLIGERQPNHPIAQLMHKVFTGPGHKVDRALKEGDEVAGFTVLDVPGHSAGHMALWRESDRTLILGDVLNSMDPLLGIRGLRLPKDFFTPDPAATASRPSAWASWSRCWCCSGTARPCATRASSWTSARSLALSAGGRSARCRRAPRRRSRSRRVASGPDRADVQAPRAGAVGREQLVLREPRHAAALGQDQRVVGDAGGHRAHRAPAAQVVDVTVSVVPS